MLTALNVNTLDPLKCDVKYAYLFTLQYRYVREYIISLISVLIPNSLRVYLTMDNIINCPCLVFYLLQIGVIIDGTGRGGWDSFVAPTLAGDQGSKPLIPRESIFRFQIVDNLVHPTVPGLCESRVLSQMGR